MKFAMYYCVSVLLLSCIFGKSTHNDREARWFGRTYTETKIQTEMVTAVMPSSCVHVEPTLPACRGLRNLHTFPEFVAQEIYPNHIRGRQLAEPPQVVSKDHQQIVLVPVNESKALSWAEYLGFVAPVVTVTAINLKTTTVIDPRTVVTFSVKGCRPSKLPMDLDRCPVNQYSVDEIVPTATLPQSISATRIPNDLLGNDVKRAKNIDIEPSSSDIIAENLSFTPTEDLSDVSLKKRSS